MAVLIHDATDARNLVLRSELLQTLGHLQRLAELVEEIADHRLPAKGETLHHCRAMNTAIVKLRLQLQWEHPLQRAFRGELNAQKRRRQEP
jgi:hypothetical protein